jgi:PIN domain nuclease of toxin-antitoxin system
LGTRLAGLVVLDTHVWLWWVDLPRRLSGTATRTIEAAERVGVAAMSVLELAELFERGRIRADVSSRAWVRAALAAVEPLALTPEIALAAAQLRFVDDPFDRVIYATARAEGAKLVTRDERIRAFDPSIALW